MWDDLKALAAAPDCLVIDPDSRLTQLGLLPVCAEDRYHLFESRAYGGASDRTLPELAAAMGEGDFRRAERHALHRRRQAPVPAAPLLTSPSAWASAKTPPSASPDPFEGELLALLSATGLPLVIDKGAGGEEAARVERAVADSGARATFWDGSFAGFARIIAGSSLYVGYDSAGQHVAAACGVPLISIFAGFPAPRMFDRWRPSGPLATVIRVDQAEPVEILAKVSQVLARYS